MTNEEIKIFREEFASIVYWKGMVKSQAARIKQLEGWNKGDSHAQAIRNAIDKLDEYKGKLKEKLKGKSYDDWRAFSKDLSTWNNKRNRATLNETKNKWYQKTADAVWL